jgi:hypothetical protein
MPRVYPPLSERFWPKVDMSAGPNGCWLWTGSSTGKKRYGLIRASGSDLRRLLAHRASYEIAYGPIPAGMFVCHTCDNPSCVNPAHLFLGTPADNTADMIAKGRRHQPRVQGDSVPNARLSASDVVSIRKMSEAGMAKKDIADRFGVTAQHIGDIVNRKWWKHVP